MECVDRQRRLTRPTLLSEGRGRTCTMRWSSDPSCVGPLSHLLLASVIFRCPFGVRGHIRLDIASRLRLTSISHTRKQRQLDQNRTRLRDFPIKEQEHKNISGSLGVYSTLRFRLRSQITQGPRTFEIISWLAVAVCTLYS